jgi:hypothetical protein
MHPLLLLPLLLLPAHLEDAKPIYKTKTLALIDRYMPTYHDVISENLYYPENGIRYVNNQRVPNPTPTKEEDILKEIGTIVHESVHHYNSSNRILVSPDKEYTLPDLTVMPSSKMVSELKKKCAIDSLFRFDTYLGPESSSQTSNAWGIVGLFDEYSAYYHGTKASYEFWKKGKSSLNETQLNDLKTDAMACYFACYEFEVFIGAYLSYTKAHEPAIYKETVNCLELKRLYTELHTNFRQLCAEIEEVFHDDYNLEYYQETYADPALRMLKLFEKDLEAITLPKAVK